MRKDKDTKVLCKNRKAEHDYFFEDTYTAGLVLSGNEVKSVKAGKCNLKGSYVTVRNGEVWLLGCNISQYGNSWEKELDTVRDRKLLLNRREIDKLQACIQEKGVTLIVSELYMQGRLVKCRLNVARGKHNYDKRRAEADRDAKREIARASKESRWTS